MADAGDLIDFNEDHDNDHEEEEEVDRTWAFQPGRFQLPAADGDNMKCELFRMRGAGCQIPRMKKPPFWTPKLSHKGLGIH